MTSALDFILKPGAIAVIGASRTQNTIGHQILKNLVDHGFTGAVYPVNPTAKSLCAIKAYPSIGDVPDHVDMAVIAVPKQHAVDVARGVRRGRRERAGRDHRRVSAKWALRAPRASARSWTSCARHGMRMVGPNCLGVINADPASP